MIVVQLIGGLGNQMFQYAAARQLAEIHQTSLKIDISEFKEYKTHKYALMHFNIIEDFISKDELFGIEDIKERFFHLEFFFTPKGEFVPLEVNIRPPGGFSIDMMNYGSNVDLFQAWADLIVNGKNELEYERKYHVLYAGRKEGIEYTNSHKDILKKYGEKISLHQELPLVFRNALGDYCYITKSDKFEEIEEMIGFIQSVSK